MAVLLLLLRLLQLRLLLLLLLLLSSFSAKKDSSWPDCCSSAPMAVQLPLSGPLDKATIAPLRRHTPMLIVWRVLAWTA
jgi:hypothetical protein